ncbi:MAG: hypothetical protein COW61_00945 [Candidatus Yonathbacteria bacterium CG17_big_fil_post_rev_8_21_14_2_50_46_19]|uniref:Uncharacterized protein n=1 Tax=Candidatus Nomurabacteria bacterium CG1_02_47_685 TaxID=1805282 RepID=A0A1J4V7U3_9BACT|nr:MAG: hypothetical protein AUJ44_03225 [Candidatus Nomurabacteria bacterium CG1_02_47_685]PIP03747.1 MAG: hypothetical protein COX54_02520 [Candidatus Yonathbacteria bacterium CG23_combo_of_CG06-09_8_20_14_all_46_18]PIQ32765.1 MAG: hypothetical protein COW61_00945 [Candidatus Yonathbacteria bacterium CG17_big_fil_post_rev_8_21_14_2_50_46_19]
MYDEETLKQKIQEATPEVRDMISNPDFGPLIQEFGIKRGATPLQCLNIADEVILALLGLSSKDTFAETIKSKFGISEDAARGMTEDININIFSQSSAPHISTTPQALVSHSTPIHDNTPQVRVIPRTPPAREQSFVSPIPHYPPEPAPAREQSFTPPISPASTPEPPREAPPPVPTSQPVAPAPQAQEVSEPKHIFEQKLQSVSRAPQEESMITPRQGQQQAVPRIDTSTAQSGDMYREPIG